MKPIRPAPPRHKPPRKFIYYYYLAVFYDIVLIFFKDGHRPQSLLEAVDIFHSPFGINIFNAEHLFYFLDSMLGQRLRLLFFVTLEMLFLFQPRDNLRKDLIQFAGF